jgi:hypothetical protein
MGIFARNRQLEQERETDYLQHVQATAAGLGRAQHTRDQAIVAARRHHKLADVAAAAGLSLSRVKQIVAPYDRAGVGPMAKLPPITENDLYLERRDKALHDGDRVLALKDVVDFDLAAHTFDSERDFLLADPARQEGGRPDIAWELYDLDPTERWVAAYVENTREVYVFRHVDGANEGPGVDTAMGSNSGPCILLGHLPTDTIVDAALNKSATNIAQGRLGGLAWLYGRIKLTNAILAAATNPSRRFIRDAEAAWDYLANLPDWERP